MEVEKTDKFVYKVPNPGTALRLYSDGTNTLRFKTTDNEITFQSVINVVPYFIARAQGLFVEDEWDVQVVHKLTNCKSIRDAFQKMASPTIYKEWYKAESVETSSTIELSDRAKEPLQKGDRYTAKMMNAALATTISVHILASSVTEIDCVFSVGPKAMRGFMENELHVSIVKQDGGFQGVTKEKCVASRWMAKGDEHICTQHTKLLVSLNDSLK